MNPNKEIKKLNNEYKKIEKEKNERFVKYMELINTLVKGKADSIVNELINERKRQGLTQQDIADRTGVKTPNIARFEGKKTIPTFQFLEKYADALGMELEYTLKKK
ncbi:MAG: helix-turn-helix transcriptional regulator [Lachnospiraceae bacterium]|nr:helix-turn-helix transcriptional regulator [Lachnospiraceae bacterium]